MSYNSGKKEYELQGSPVLSRITVTTPIPGDTNYRPVHMGAQFHQGMIVFYINEHASEEAAAQLRSAVDSFKRGDDGLLENTTEKAPFIGVRFIGDVSINSKTPQILAKLEQEGLLGAETCEKCVDALRIEQLEPYYVAPQQDNAPNNASETPPPSKNNAMAHAYRGEGEYAPKNNDVISNIVATIPLPGDSDYRAAGKYMQYHQGRVIIYFDESADPQKIDEIKKVVKQLSRRSDNIVDDPIVKGHGIFYKGDVLLNTETEKMLKKLSQKGLLEPDELTQAMDALRVNDRQIKPPSHVVRDLKIQKQKEQPREPGQPQ